MREETRNWLEQAREDLSAAEANLRIGKYFITAFLSQQCVEKALKAVAIEKTREIPRMHDVFRLGEQLKVPQPVLSDLIELNEDYAVARYPDAANGVPAKAYDFKKADRKLHSAQRVLNWVITCLGK